MEGQPISPDVELEAEPFSFCPRDPRIWGLFAQELYYDTGNASEHNIQALLLITTIRSYRSSYEKMKGIAPEGIECVWMIEESPVSVANQALMHLQDLVGAGKSVLVLANDESDLHSMAALWLKRSYMLDVQEAVHEMEAHLTSQHINSKCSIDRIVTMLSPARVSPVMPFHPHKHIHFVRMGGTIDKLYPKIKRGYAFEFGEPAATRMMERIPHTFEYHVTDVCAKDSLDISTHDRLSLLSVCRQSSSRCIVVTHGTDGLLNTASTLAAAEMTDKVILVTGAFLPAAFKDSDADFNLGASIAAVRLLAPGVYVCMNAEVLPWFAATRDGTSGLFINGFGEA